MARRVEPAEPLEGPRRGRVALLAGCVADVLAPDINAAATRVLTRHGFEVVSAPGESKVVNVPSGLRTKPWNTLFASR